MEDLFHHAPAVLHAPAYREANAGALRMEWPRIPVPGWPDREAVGAAREELEVSAARGRELAALLDSETPVTGVTGGGLRPELAVVAVPATVWDYKLGGYQVLKKWLSYRERGVLGRPLRAEEIQHFTDTARRIAAILLLTTGWGSGPRPAE